MRHRPSCVHLTDPCSFTRAPVAAEELEREFLSALVETSVFKRFNSSYPQLHELPIDEKLRHISITFNNQDKPHTFDLQISSDCLDILEQGGELQNQEHGSIILDASQIWPELKQNSSQGAWQQVDLSDLDFRFAVSQYTFARGCISLINVI
jgi:hypothetical protein